MLNRYNTFELCNGLKPFLLRYLFASTDHRKLCYFDSDIFIFDSLDKDVWEALESCSILLTPHLCRLPEEDPDLVWRDLAVLQHGVYNGGFIGMRRSAEANEFLRWWASRIIACGYKKLEEGMNCDQRWLDLVPGFGLNVRISRHPGLNAAYWNLHERQFELREGRHAVNGEGLKFFHFSGYSVDKPEAITKHWTRFTFENRPDVRKIFDEYREHLTRASQASVAMKVTEGPHVFAAPGAGTVSSHHPEAQPKDRNVRGSQQERDSSAGSILSADQGARDDVDVIGQTRWEGEEKGVGFSRPVRKPDGVPCNKSISPEVSIVIPSFNAARFIREAIESVLKQSLRNCEIIVVDDGSTDETAAIVAGYEERVRYLSQAHAGVSMARNCGIDAARAPFVAFLDADDFFVMPSKLEEQLTFFHRESDLGMVHTGWRITDERGTLILEKSPWVDVPELTLKDWLRSPVVFPSAMMFRRDALREVGGFDSRLDPLEDVDLVLRISRKGYTSTWLKKITVAYRQHDANASSKVSKQDAALRTVLDQFFAEPDLPNDIRSLEREVRYNTLVWTACRYHRAGNYGEMARSLVHSLRYSHLSPSEAMLDWIERFKKTYADDHGIRLSVFELLELDELRQIVRSQLLEISPDEAFFPSSRKKSPLKWTVPIAPAAAGYNGKRDPASSRAISGTGGERLDDSDFPAKLNLSDALRRDYGRHRSGWRFALETLRPLHDSGGIYVDPFPEHTFDEVTAKRAAPHGEPWIGFFHNPPAMPSWFVNQQSPQRLWENEAFQQSLKYCVGAFCLSRYHKQWLEEHLSVPVVSLLHPAPRPQRTFSVDNFLANAEKKIVQIGSWLRKLHSIYHLPVTRLKRAIVHQHMPYIDELFAIEKKEYGLEPDYGAVQVLNFLADDEYDELLSRNIVYLELYDSSANNTIVECLVRSTPVLVNPLPAVREYLGEEYPFYFSNRTQAARKAEDIGLIVETHQYLQAHPIKQKLAPAFFLKSVAESEIYGKLPYADQSASSVSTTVCENAPSARSHNRHLLRDFES